MSKTALITGASSGIGAEIAKILSSEGFKVILTARRENKLRSLADSLCGESRIVVCDLSLPEECERLYNELKNEKISVLVNNAGFGSLGKFTEIPLETELKMIDTNIKAVHILTKLFLKDFVKADRGYILNVASSAGLMPGGPMMAAYYATKSYVVSLTGAIYEELRSSGSNVHISALCPGPVDTEFNSVAGCEFSVGPISARECAETGVSGLFEKKLIIVPGKTIRLSEAAARLTPRKLALAVAGKIQHSKIK
ncbi:MAG: SDR family oxidoreductase [Ruminococcus sp.]|nr:SDR family oxidoreductase [Ruminococcus sp.]